MFAEHRNQSVIVGGKGYATTFRIHNNCLLRESIRLDNFYKESFRIGCVQELEVISPTSNLNISCVLFGVSDGHVYAVGSDNSIVAKITAHDAEVVGIALVESTFHGHFATIGKDQKIKLWSKDLRLLRVIELHRIFNQSIFHLYGLSPIQFTFCQKSCCFLIHFESGYLVEVSLEMLSYLLITERHQDEELHSLAWSPSNNDLFSTGGDDGMIRVWDYPKKYCLRRKKLPFSIRSILWSAQGDCLVVGSSLLNPRIKNFKQGRVNPSSVSNVCITSYLANLSITGMLAVLDSQSLEVIREERKAKTHINDIQFNPSCCKLAVGTGEGTVLICDYLNLQTLHTIKLGYSRPVHRVDFSADEELVRVNYYPDRLAYYSFSEGKEVRDPTAVREVTWNTCSCSYSWTTQGKQLIAFSLP
jgi:WD40 repeat protein